MDKTWEEGRIHRNQQIEMREVLKGITSEDDFDYVKGHVSHRDMDFALFFRGEILKWCYDIDNRSLRCHSLSNQLLVDRTKMKLEVLLKLPPDSIKETRYY